MPSRWKGPRCPHSLPPPQVRPMASRALPILTQRHRPATPATGLHSFIPTPSFCTSQTRCL